MLLYRAFHAQRNYLRPCLGESAWGRGNQNSGLFGQPRSLPTKRVGRYFEIDPAAVCQNDGYFGEGRICGTQEG